MVQFSCQIIRQKSDTVTEVGPKNAMLRRTVIKYGQNQEPRAKSQGRFTNFKPNKGSVLKGGLLPFEFPGLARCAEA